MNRQWSRREFLEFMGKTSLAASVSASLLSCVTKAPQAPSLPFLPLAPGSTDELRLANGFLYQIVIKWDDMLNTKGDRFGFNNDYTAFFPMRPGVTDEGLLWVNHESQEPLFVSGWSRGQKRKREDVMQEMKAVGGSIVHLKKSSGSWVVIKESRYNRRLDAFTKIPFVSDRPVEGKTSAQGTLANCAGGITPWGTVLTCEENYDDFYGETIITNGKKTWLPGSNYTYWRDFYPNPPEHYGWVNEIDPFTGKAKKLVALGRFSHESATVALANDGRPVVYSGDDHNNECLYKFISSQRGSLEKGELFVADIENGKWLSLDRSKHPGLQKRFKDQTDVLIHCREAARIVGATLLDRPEDVEIDPKSKAVFVALTNNKPKGNLHGSIMKIVEDGGDHAALTFKASTFQTGGTDAGFSCPDNLAFDLKGNLWMTNDISDSVLNKGPYQPFGNNSLFYIPMSGKNAGEVIRVATAPMTAEFTGPSFSPDGRTLFLSVQHPGEGTEDLKNPLSRWPEGGTSLPKSSVVAISGPALDSLIL